MGFIYIIVFWLLIPSLYSFFLAEKISDFFGFYRSDKAEAIWTMIDIIVIRLGYVFLNFTFLAKVIFNADVRGALIYGGVFFGIAMFFALLKMLFDWLSDVKVVSSTVVLIAALVIGYLTDNMNIAGAFIFITNTIIIIYAISKKISKKR